MNNLIERIAERFTNILGAKGTQNQRKDKDLMNDTGGRSKGRPREPDQKPDRADKKNRYKPKRKTEQDKDTDDDPDLKQSNIHPLDRQQKIFGGAITEPEENYYRAVWSSLVDALAFEEDVSEKDFSNRESIHARADNLLRRADIMDIVDDYESDNARPDLCAEILFQHYC